MSSFIFNPFGITETSLPPAQDHDPSPRPFAAFDEAELEAAIGLIPQTICTTFPSQSTSHYQQKPNPQASQLDVTYPNPIPTSATVQPQVATSPCPLPPNFDLPQPSSHSHPSTHKETPPNNPSSSTISTPPNSTPPLLPPNSTLSAVDLAKRAAEQITIEELAKKRRNSEGVPIDAKRYKPDLSASDEDHPEKISHRKYQKRLQKNRDSAFVSRIRRREYTRILEKSLAEVEKEKNDAVTRFLDMKQRFELVSAELNGMRQIARSGIAHLRDSVIATVPAADPNTDSNPARPRRAVTMFMFALMFGAILPDMDTKSTSAASAATKVFGFLQRNAGGKGTEARVVSGMADAVKGTRGSVWGTGVKRAGGMDMIVLPTRQRLLAYMRADVQSLLGDTSVEDVMERIEAVVDNLSEAEMVSINTALQQERDRDTKAAERVSKVVEQLRDSSNTKNAERALDELSEQLGRLGLEGEL